MASDDFFGTWVFFEQGSSERIYLDLGGFVSASAFCTHAGNFGRTARQRNCGEMLVNFLATEFVRK